MPRDSKSKYWRRIRHEARHQQVTAASEGDETDDGGKVRGIAAALHGIEQELATSNDQNTPDKQRERSWKVWEVIGIWAAAFVGLLAIGWSAWDSFAQRGLMQGQLDQMKAATDISIAQLSAVITLKWEGHEVNDSLGHQWIVLPHLFNRSATKAIDLQGWIKSRYYPKSGPLRIVKLFSFRGDDPGTGNGPYVIGPNDDEYLEPTTIAESELRDLVANRGTRLIWAYIQYRDVFQHTKLHHLRACTVATPVALDNKGGYGLTFPQKGACQNAAD